MTLNNLHKAIKIATLAHEGQDDRSGAPYIYHLFYVSEKQTTTEGKILGLLHDSVEDGKLTLPLIETEFGKETAEYVDCISRREGESWKNYISRVMRHEVTMRCKLSDIEHNTLVSRVDAKAVKNFSMYKEAYDRICSELNNPFPFAP